MMKKTALALFLSAALASASATAETVVTVNGTRIDSSAIDQQVKIIGEQSNGQVQDSPALRENIARRLVTRELMMQEARRLKLHETPEYKNIIESARNEARTSGEDRKPTFASDWATFEGNVTAQALIAHILNNNPVTDAQVQQAYNEITNRYRGTQEVQLGEIIVNSRDNAQKVGEALRRGQRFSDVARQYTIDPQSKSRGGINPEFTPLKDLEDAAPEVYNAVKSLNRGAYTRTPVEGNGIFAFFYINNKRAVNVPPFAQLKPQIQQDLQNLLIEREIARLYQQATIR
ncbi:SurA N-terminal domain-containing protein [Neisseria shayeganii]|uniref:peptidylprolyl isomerase n=1 Tax=Neisseria shayeganii 871 TaxID=1032488 RepID=G4CK81_9NEIS|nr:SurA N-terminal domain-containing protein [Neisseria shayeganii]EGY51808.1 peptidyl-prolyl cis-trans isomerase [Neisseria shayeganii 871]